MQYIQELTIILKKMRRTIYIFILFLYFFTNEFILIVIADSGIRNHYMNIKNTKYFLTKITPFFLYGDYITIYTLFSFEMERLLV